MNQTSGKLRPVQNSAAAFESTAVNQTPKRPGAPDSWILINDAEGDWYQPGEVSEFLNCNLIKSVVDLQDPQHLILKAPDQIERYITQDAKQYTEFIKRIWQLNKKLF